MCDGSFVLAKYCTVDYIMIFYKILAAPSLKFLYHPALLFIPMYCMFIAVLVSTILS